MKNATVSAGILRSIINFAAENGAERDALLNEIDITDEQLHDQDARIPFSAYQQLIRFAIAETNDPLLLVKHAFDTRIENISVVGLIVGSAASFPDAMNQLNRYAKLMVEIDIMDGEQRFSVDTSGGEFWIIDNRPDPNSFPQLTEAAFARLIGEFRYSFPDEPYALQAEMTHAEPAHAKEIEEHFNCKITYGANRNALQIDPAWLSKPFEDTSRYAFGIFTEKADALLADLEKQESVRAQIEAKLIPELHKGNFSIDEMAADLGMSRATLYRRLKEEETTFAELVDELRCRMASDYLSAKKISINETAYLVGFAEASSFVRAFRRWTGQTPANYRDAVLAS